MRSTCRGPPRSSRRRCAGSPVASLLSLSRSHDDSLTMPPLLPPRPCLTLTNVCRCVGCALGIAIALANPRKQERASKCHVPPPSRAEELSGHGLGLWPHVRRHAARAAHLALLRLGVPHRAASSSQQHATTRRRTTHTSERHLSTTAALGHVAPRQPRPSRRTPGANLMSGWRAHAATQLGCSCLDGLQAAPQPGAHALGHRTRTQPRPLATAQRPHTAVEVRWDRRELAAAAGS